MEYAELLELLMDVRDAVATGGADLTAIRLEIDTCCPEGRATTAETGTGA